MEPQPPGGGEPTNGAEHEIVLPPPAPPTPGDPPVNPAINAAALSTSLNPRLAPQDLDAERSVLGGVLLTNDAMFDIAEKVKPEDFYREPHRRIFQAMIDLSMRNEPIDVITLGDELRKKGELESVGGPAYIAALDATVPATANLGRYAKIVRDKALARRLIQTAHTIAREGYDQIGDVNTLLDSAEQKIFEVTDRKEASRLTPLGTSVKRVFQNLNELYEKKLDLTGVASGFAMVDELTSGFQPGDLIIVAGRPSMGKTSFVMNVASHVAIENALPVVVFSLEMSADALTLRMLASEARVDGQRLRSGKLLDSDWPKLARAADRLFRAPMYIDDAAGLSALDLRAQCRRLKARHDNLSLVVVDYLQLMRGHADNDNREQEIADISRSLKALAKELKVPVVALSQLNRSLERREDKRPQLSDLRESGSLEQDSDVICFIYRDEVYNKESADKGIAEIIIGKQRNGPTGIARVAFLRDYTRFENLAKEQSYGGSVE